MRSLELSELILTRLRHPGPDGRDSEREVPLHRQIYRIVRTALLEQRLLPGARLPSSRDLSADLGVSRNTVIAAISELLAEGYLVARRGSGTYIADTLPDATQGPASAIRTPAAASAARSLSSRGSALTRESGAECNEVLPFVPGVLEVPEFPFQVWARLQAKYWRYLDRNLLDYGNAGGYVPLRRAIAQHLALSRGVRVCPEQVLITSGTQQAIDLVARLMTDPGDTAWIEDPCYWGAKRALLAADLHLHPVPVDEDGLAPGANDWAMRPRLIYVTPSHQYPLGHVMSMQRRETLLDYAARNDAWIFEDDYDNEVHYAGKPLAALQGMDRDARVIYAGTFSKVMYPGVRLGYLVVPEDLVGAFNTGLYDLYRPGQLILQAALSDFINEGHMAALIRRLRVTYKARRDLLARLLRQALGARATITGSDAGLHLCLRFTNPDIDDTRVAETLSLSRFQVRPLSAYHVCPDVPPATTRHRGLVIGYAYIPDDRVEPASERLAEAISAALEDRVAGVEQN